MSDLWKGPEPEVIRRRKRERHLADPVFRDLLETHWRPVWKGMGVAVVAAQVMARHGPAVDDSAWGSLKIEEARLWLMEELAEAEREKTTTRDRAAMSFWLSILAACISLAAMLIAAGTFALRWWG